MDTFRESSRQKEHGAKVCIYFRSNRTLVQSEGTEKGGENYERKKERGLVNRAHVA